MISISKHLSASQNFYWWRGVSFWTELSFWWYPFTAGWTALVSKWYCATPPPPPPPPPPHTHTHIHIFGWAVFGRNHKANSAHCASWQSLWRIAISFKSFRHSYNYSPPQSGVWEWCSWANWRLRFLQPDRAKGNVCCCTTFGNYNQIHSCQNIVVAVKIVL